MKIQPASTRWLPLALLLAACPAREEEPGEPITPAEEAPVDLPPTAPALRLEPDLPLAGEAVSVFLTRASADPEGLPVEHRTRWTLDGAEVAADGTPLGTAPTLAAGLTAKGQTLTVAVSGWDGAQLGAAAELSRVLGNRPPELSVLVLPTAPRTSQDLTAVVSASDPDGDPVTPSFHWEVLDGDTSDCLPLENTPTLPASCTARGQRWAVRATASDGEGEVEGLAVVSVVNTAPQPPTVVLSPAEPGTLDDLLCEGTPGLDLDADDPVEIVAYTWYRDGDVYNETGEPPEDSATLASSTLPLGATARDEVWLCSATSSDGTVSLPAAPSNAVTIGNTPPEVAAPSISPDGGTLLFDFTCLVPDPTDVDVADAAGLTVGLWWQRALDDGSCPDLADLSSPACALGVGGPQLWAQPDSPEYVRGDQIVCIAVPSDGLSLGEPQVSGPVEIGNALPTLDEVALDPAQVSRASDVEAVWAAGAFSDPDGDGEGDFEFEWFVDDQSIQQGPSEFLAASLFEAGQIVYVAVTPVDSEGGVGAVVESDSAYVQNAAPDIVGWITPADAWLGAQLVLQWDPPTDADGDDVDIAFHWQINGSSSSSDDSSLTTANLARGDVVTAYFVLDDDSGSPTWVEAKPEGGVELGNAPPSGGAVSLTAAPGPTAVAGAADKLLCSLTEAAEDPEGDVLSYTVQWRVAEPPGLPGAPEESGAGVLPWSVGDSLSRSVSDTSVFSAHQSWQCRVTALDPESAGPGVPGSWSEPVVLSPPCAALEADRPVDADSLEVAPFLYDALNSSAADEAVGGSVELWLRPAGVQTSTWLDLSEGPVLIEQSGSDLVVEVGTASLTLPDALAPWSLEPVPPWTRWHHVAVTISGSASDAVAVVHVDGLVRDSFPVSGANWPISNPDLRLAAGAWGFLDEVRLSARPTYVSGDGEPFDFVPARVADPVDAHVLLPLTEGSGDPVDGGGNVLSGSSLGWSDGTFGTTACDANRPPPRPELDVGRLLSGPNTADDEGADLPVWPEEHMTCLVASSLDPDGDLIATTRAWVKDWDDLGLDDVELDAANFDLGDTLTCTVTQDDGTHATPAVQRGAAVGDQWSLDSDKYGSAHWLEIDDGGASNPVAGSWSLDLQARFESPPPGGSWLVHRPDGASGELGWGVSVSPHLTGVQIAYLEGGATICFVDVPAWPGPNGADALLLVERSAAGVELLLMEPPVEETPRSLQWPPGTINEYSLDVLAESGACSPTSAAPASTEPLTVLSSGDPSDLQLFAGQLDWLRISDTARRSEELVLETFHGVDAATLLYLPLEDGSPASSASIDVRSPSAPATAELFSDPATTSSPWFCRAPPCD